MDVKETHHRAMEFAERAEAATNAKWHVEAKRHYQSAYVLEFDAACRTDVQPSRAILFRSAAWLALHAGFPAITVAVAKLGLLDAPSEIAEELEEALKAGVKAQQSS